MTIRSIQCPYCRRPIALDEKSSVAGTNCPECHRFLDATILARLASLPTRSGSSGGTSTPSPASKPTGSTSVALKSKANKQGDFFSSSEESSDERIKTVTRQMGYDEANEDKGSDAEKIWKPGDQLLGGKYQVLELAPGVPYAEGGVGIVHRVHHLEWDIDFAVKSPKPAFIMSESGKQSFEKECQTWIELGLHTNIVTCYLVRRIGGIPRVFAEYVGDGTLKDWIADGRLYQGTRAEVLERILDIAIQFAWGLDHAHQQGLLHLDVKPGNVMMSGDTAKVTDFGLAKVVQTDSARGDQGMMADGELSAAFCDGMTPSYCSPEQYDAFKKFQSEETKTVRSNITDSKRGAGGDKGHFISDGNGGIGESPDVSDASDLLDLSEDRITKQSDIWSWAISILSMFHGRSPCKKGGQTAAEVFEVFLKIEPPPHRPPVPAGMIDLFRHCFQKNPANRPESMAVVADRLVEIYAEEIGKPYPRKKPANTAFTAEIFCNRAISMLDLGKTLEATKLARRAASMSFWHPQISFDNALIEWRFGLISDLQALERMEELRKHNAQDPYSFYALGLLQKERANPKAALQALEKAVEMDPSRPEFRKAIELCKKAAPIESRCSGRFVLKLIEKAESPDVYSDAGQNFVLIPTSETTGSLVSAATGQVAVQFKKATVTLSDGKPLEGISVDYRRDLLRLDPVTILLRNKGGKASIDPEDKLAISMEEALSKLAPEEPLHRIPWGKKQDAFNKKGTIRLSIRDNVVDVYNVASGKRILTLSGHKSDVTAVYITPDGKWGITGSFDSSLKIWHINSGRCVRTFRGLAGSVDALWMDDAHRYVLTQVLGTSIQLWNVDLLCNQKKLTTAPMMICLVSSSEEVSRRQSELETLIGEMKKAAGVEDYALAVETMKKASRIDGWQTIRPELNLPDLLGRHSGIAGIADVVSASMFQAHEDAITSLALSYDGKTAISAGKDQVLRHWRFPKGECVHEMDAHYDWIRSVDLTIDGRYAVSGSWDKTVRIWNLSTGRQIRKLEEPVKNLTQIKIAPDSQTLAVSSGWGEISLWSAASGRKINSVAANEGAIHAIQFSRDGRLLLSGSERRQMTLWDARKLASIRSLTGFQNEVLSVALSPNGLWAVGAEAGGDLLLFDLSQEKPVPKRLSGHLGDVSSVLFLPDNRRFVSAGKDKTVRFWSVAGTLEKTLSGSAGGINTVAVDITRSSLLTGGEDAMLRLWNIFWDYEYPGSLASKEELTEMLRAILNHHSRMMEISLLKRNPSDFYDPAIKPASFDAYPVGKIFDERVIARTLVEMEIRGYGNVPHEELRRLLREILG